MAGYNYKKGMSNNAVEAYKNGKKPLSRWQKKDILAILEKEFGVESTQYKLLKGVSLEILRKNILFSDEFHHTSRHFTATKFYQVRLDTAKYATADDIEEWKQKHNQAQAKKNKVSPRRKGTIKFFEWKGNVGEKLTPVEKQLENVLIERKGCFFFIYNDGGILLCRKKVTAHGVNVCYEPTPEEIEAKKRKQELKRLKEMEREAKRRKREKRRERWRKAIASFKD